MSKVFSYILLALKLLTTKLKKQKKTPLQCPLKLVDECKKVVCPKPK